jgi:hypothetical protein
MHEDPIQILEVRADAEQRSVMITAAVTADASRAIFIALSEQLVSPALSSWLKCGRLWHGTNWTSQAGVGVE